MHEIDKTGLEAATEMLRSLTGTDLNTAERAEATISAYLASTTSAGVTEEQTPQFWLAELDPHGNPRLLDGAHRTREGVEKAAYLHMRLGLQKGLTFACAEVHITPVEAAPHGANEEALSILSARNQPHER